MCDVVWPSHLPLFTYSSCIPRSCVQVCSNTMGRRITSNATVDSSDESDGTGTPGLGDDEVSGSSATTILPVTSGSDDDGGPLGQAIDKILTGKTKKKGKGKAKQPESECSHSIYAHLCSNFSCCVAENPENEMDGEFAKKITFNIAMFSAKEHSKDLKKRTGKNTYMVLNDNEPFDTWSAQLLVKINKTLNPSKLNINDYEIHFTVARV